MANRFSSLTAVFLAAALVASSGCKGKQSPVAPDPTQRPGQQVGGSLEPAGGLQTLLIEDPMRISPDIKAELKSFSGVPEQVNGGGSRYRFTYLLEVKSTVKSSITVLLRDGNGRSEQIGGTSFNDAGGTNTASITDHRTDWKPTEFVVAVTRFQPVRDASASVELK